MIALQHHITHKPQFKYRDSSIDLYSGEYDYLRIAAATKYGFIFFIFNWFIIDVRTSHKYIQ